MTIDNLLDSVRLYNNNEEDIRKIKKAYEVANVLHNGQYRASKEPYIIHPLNVAIILAELKMDTDTICAGLLHDTIEDTSITKEEIEIQFNSEVSMLVDGVSKIKGINFSSKNEKNLANTRKIITGFIKDIRVIIIKLADRLHNMRTLQYKNESKQKENALETLELFAPLAYCIGLYNIKNELENLSFYYLNYDLYKYLEEKRDIIKYENKDCLNEMLYNISKILDDNSISNEIKVRIKNIYGIYNTIYKGKLKSKNKNIDSVLSNIHDLLSLKITVDNTSDCYLTLGIIHQAYHPINDRFKDYICNPKTNMYQSLHTTVFGENNRLVQTQIRTFEMDEIAAFGFPAYWNIKKGNAREEMQSILKEKYQFFSSLIEIDRIFKDNQDFVNHVKNELLSKKIYVYAPTGNIVELPKGATPIDYAYKVGSENNMISALVNDEDVGLDYKLENKDRIKIVTGAKSNGPKEEWLNMARTTKAKAKIKAHIK